MIKANLPLNELVHDSLVTVMCFAYSRIPLHDMMEQSFQGSWKYLSKSLFSLSERKANRSCMELALFLRAFDDSEALSSSLSHSPSPPVCGKLYFEDGKERDIFVRDAADKIIHSAELIWDFAPNEAAGSSRPVLICIAHSAEKRRWIKAEIDLVAVAAICGLIAH